GRALPGHRPGPGRVPPAGGTGRRPHLDGTQSRPGRDGAVHASGGGVMISGDGTVLIVDDRQENLIALSALLEPLGHQVVTANSGEQALRTLLRSEPSVILLDVQMPGMDGFETATQIKERERTKDIPIIFLTAYGRDAADAIRAFSTGAVDF